MLGVAAAACTVLWFTLLAERPLFDRRGIATLGQFARVWQSSSRGFAVMRQDTRDRLAGRAVPMREIGRFPDRLLMSR